MPSKQPDEDDERELELYKRSYEQLRHWYHHFNYAANHRGCFFVAETESLFRDIWKLQEKKGETDA